MNKIGIAIKPTVHGNSQPIVVNEGEWALKIREIRHILQHFPSIKSDHNKIVTFLFFDEKGCYLVVARTITNNELENISGWIHIPNDLLISSAELEDLIDKIRYIVSLSEIPPKEYLQKEFGHKQYPQRTNPLDFEPSPQNLRFAKRRIQDQQVATILNEYIYLPSYKNFNAILLEECKGEVVDAQDITEICNNEQKKLKDTQERGKKKLQEKPGQNSSPIITAPSKSQTSDTTSSVQKVQKDTIISNPKEDSQFQSELSQQSIIRKYRFAKLVLTHLACLISGIVIGCLIMFFYNDLSQNETTQNIEVLSLNNSAIDQTSPSLEAEAIAYLDGNKVNEKLVWRRSEMETYPILKGLYDALNEFDFNKVIYEYAPQLTGSNEFNTLMSHIENNHKNGWETYAKKKTTSGTYNETGDDMIDINNYKLWIDSNCTKATDSSVAPKSPAQGPTQVTPQAKPAISKHNKPKTSKPKSENKGGTTSTNKPEQKPQPNKNGRGNTTSQSMEGL